MDFPQSFHFGARERALLPLLFWLAVIFSFSSFPGVSTTSAPPLWYFMERKGAHVFEYTVLTFLSFRFFRLSFREASLAIVLFLSMMFSLSYGATDELHQYFVPFRGAYMRDVAIDGGGALLAGALIFFWQRTKNRPL